MIHKIEENSNQLGYLSLEPVIDYNVVLEHDDVAEHIWGDISRVIEMKRLYCISDLYACVTRGKV